MGKSLRKKQAKLAARMKATVAIRQIAVARNWKLGPVIEKAFKMPGSMKAKAK